MMDSAERRPAHGREQLATAITMYREMGTTYWMERAETGMAELY
jgi:hypothetical protein